MEVCHDDEAANNCHYAPELDFVITLNAARKVICDWAMKFYHKEACDCDGDTAKEPAPAECPLHKHNYSTTSTCMLLNNLVK